MQKCASVSVQEPADEDDEVAADGGTECKRCKKVMFQSARDSENFLESMKPTKLVIEVFGK